MLAVGLGGREPPEWGWALGTRGLLREASSSSVLLPVP